MILATLFQEMIFGEDLNKNAPINEEFNLRVVHLSFTWAADGLSDDVPTMRCWYGLCRPRCSESWLLAAEDIGEGVEWELSSIEVLKRKNCFEILDSNGQTQTFCYICMIKLLFLVKSVPVVRSCVAELKHLKTDKIEKRVLNGVVFNVQS